NGESGLRSRTAGGGCGSSFQPPPARECLDGDVVGNSVCGAENRDALCGNRRSALSGAEGESGLGCDQTLQDRRVDVGALNREVTSRQAAGRKNAAVEQ